MTQYLISFDAHAMDHIPDEDMPAVAKASHEVELCGHVRLHLLQQNLSLLRR